MIEKRIEKGKKEMNKSLKQVLLSGYLYSVLASLLGTQFFLLINTIIYTIKNNKWPDSFFLEWTDSFFLFVPGAIFSFVPAGLGGAILAYLLWRSAQKELLSLTSAFLTGGVVGLDSILLVLLLAYISPLHAVFVRMSLSVFIQYLVLLLTLSFFLGGWVGRKLAIMLNKQFE